MLIPDRNAGPGVDRSNILLQNLIDLDTSTDRARELATIPMLLVKAGALLNFAVLVMATVCPEAELNFAWTWILLVLCVAPIGLGTGALFLIAHYKISNKERNLSW